MKYAPRLYAQALSEVVSDRLTPEQEKKFLKNFIDIVKRNGDLYEIKKIIAETEKLLREKSGRRKLTIETARPVTAEKLRALIRNVARGSDIIEEKIDPTLIAGVTITVNDEFQLDGSLARKLKKLFSYV